MTAAFTWTYCGGVDMRQSSLFAFFSSLIQPHIGLYLRLSDSHPMMVVQSVGAKFPGPFCGSSAMIYFYAFPVVWGLLIDPCSLLPLPTSPSVPWQWYVSCKPVSLILCGTPMGFNHVLDITCKWSFHYLCSVCLTGLNVSLFWSTELLKTAWFHCVSGLSSCPLEYGRARFFSLHLSLRHLDRLSALATNNADTTIAVPVTFARMLFSDILPGRDTRSCGSSVFFS